MLERQHLQVVLWCCALLQFSATMPAAGTCCAAEMLKLCSAAVSKHCGVPRPLSAIWRHAGFLFVCASVLLAA